MKRIVSNYLNNVNPIGLFPTILFIGLAISPLVFWPSAKVPYEVPRVQFIEHWIEIMAIAAIPSLLKLKKKNINSKLLFSVNLLFLIAIITAIVGSNFNKSLVGNYYRNDGLITFGHFLILFYLTALLWREKWKIMLYRSIAIGSTLATIWVLIDGVKFFIFHQNVVNFQNALGGTFGQPNFLGGYLLVTMPLTLFQIVKSNKKQRFIWIGFIILQIIAILLTNSRASILGIPILFISFAILQKNKYKKALIALSIIAISVSSIFFFKQYKSQIVPNRIGAEGRTRIFTKAIIGFSQKPLLGWGWANFDYLFASIDWPIKLGNDVYVDKPHSTILEIATTTGIFGLIIYLAILTQGLILLYKKEKYLCLVFLLFILHSQTNIISSAEEVIFWISLGVAAQPVLSKL